MRVALFGGTGFVGSYLVRALVGAGHHPVLLVRPGSESRVEGAEHGTTVAGHIGQRDAVAAAVEGCDAAIYNIGILREEPSAGITFEALQLEGAKRAIDVAAAAGVKRFLLMSANGVKLDGTPYQRTKYLAERHLAESSMDWTVFRPSVIFGDPQGRMEFVTQLKRDMIDPPIPAPLFFSGLSPKNTFRMSPVAVGDVAQAFVKSLEHQDTYGRILTLCGPDAVTWPEILAIITAAAGRRKAFVPVPIWGLRMVAALLDRFPFFPVTRDQLVMLAEGNTGDSADVFRLLGINPETFSANTLSYINPT